MAKCDPIIYLDYLHCLPFDKLAHELLMSDYSMDKKEIGQMTKDDLETGMLAQMRNGRWLLFIREIKNPKGDKGMFVNIHDFGWASLDGYYDNLKDSMFELREYDIVKVATISPYINNVLKAIYNFGKNIEKHSDFKVIWQEDNKRKELEDEIRKTTEQLEMLQKKLKECE